MKSMLPFLAACFAMGLVGSYVGHRSHSDPEPAGATELASRGAHAGSTGGDLSAIVERIDAIERRLDELSMARPAPRTAAEPKASTDGEAALDRDALDAIVARLDALEGEIDRDRDEARMRDLPLLGSIGVVREEMTKEEARLAVLNAASTEAEKLAAWSELRSGGWDEQVVAEMIRVAETTTDPAVRADVWRQADARDRDTQLVRPLLHSLVHDPDASVRSEAAETLLGNFYDEPGVSAALAHAAQFDPDEDVRDEARGKR